VTAGAAPDPAGLLLDVAGLHVELRLHGVFRPVIHDATLQIRAGEAVGLVGESGSGKSMSSRAIARLLPAGARVTGDILFQGRSVLGMSSAELRRYRARDIAMVFQDPRAHTNPVRRVGDFLTEALRTTMGIAADEATRRAVHVLAEVGIEDGERLLRQYPHELSGGMLQRVMIGAALLAEPKLLLADEPTTSLDVTTQAEVMAILDELRRERGVAVLFITHDLELAAAVCDRTYVIYAGSIVEQQASSTLNVDPLHPYTAALLAARPRLVGPAGRLTAIPGRPRSAFEVGEGCAFADRCPYAEPECIASEQVMRQVGAGIVRCRRSEAIHGALQAISMEAGAVD
jgi:oligopeptide/dipeptide ABC transporter ATP-binding protein